MEIDALVLRVTPFRAQDAMVLAIDQNKTYSFLARGVRKTQSKNSFSLLPWSYSHFSLLKTKDGLSLKTGSLINDYGVLRSNFEHLAMLDFLSEATMKLIHEKELSKVYLSLKKILELLVNGFSPKTLQIIYLATLLRHSGYSWNVDSCQKCGQKSVIVATNTGSGGFICENCFDGVNGVKLTTRLLKIIRYIFMVEPEMYDHIAFSDDECKTVMALLEEFLVQTVEVTLKSTKIL